MQKEFDFKSPRQEDVIPKENSEQNLKLWKLRDSLTFVWDKDTVGEWERHLWTKEVPSFGQCVVTALVVQDIFGGNIVKDPDNDHYWNILEGGVEVDLTRSQFPTGIVFNAKESRTREYMLTSERAAAAKTQERYLILRARVRNFLGF